MIVSHAFSGKVYLTQGSDTSTYGRAKDVLKKVTKPTDMEAKALSKYFPSHHSKKAFNPIDECFRPKKAGSRKERPVAITVVMLKTFKMLVPKGKVRQNMMRDGKIQTLRVTRSASAKVIRNKIMNAFKVSEYTVLECVAGGHNLLRCCDQEIDGERVVERRGCLYLCEEFGDEVSLLLI